MAPLGAQRSCISVCPSRSTQCSSSSLLTLNFSCNCLPAFQSKNVSDAKVKVTQQRHRLEFSWSFAARVEFPRTNSLLHCSQQMSKRATDHSGDLTWLVNYAFQTGIMSQPRCLFSGAPLPKLPLPYPSLTPEASRSPYPYANT